MATNYGLINSGVDVLRSGLMGLKEAQTARDVNEQRQRDQKLQLLLSGAQQDEQGNFSFTPEELARRDQKQKFEQSQMELNDLAKRSQVKTEEAGLLGKGIVYDENGKASFTPQKLQEQQLDMAKIRAQTAKEQADATKALREAGQKDNPMAKLSGDIKQKLGYIQTVGKSADALEKLFNTGPESGPQYVDANSPMVGKALSDTAWTAAARQAAENYGRLQSGGAINHEEEGRFMAMLPRASDTPAVAAQKFQQIREEMADKKALFLGENPDSVQPTQQLSKIAKQPAKGLISGGTPPKVANKPKTVIQNGHTYTLNPSTGEYE